MAERTTVDCDRCGAKEIASDRRAGVYVTVGREFDGVESCDDQRRVDLCPTCARKALQEFLRGLDYDTALAWYQKWRPAASPAGTRENASS